MPKDEKDKIELKTLTSFKDLQLDSPERTEDLTEDAWSFGAPPPAGVYNFKWFMAKEGIKIGYTVKDDPSTVFANVSLEGVLQDDKEWEDSRAYAYLDSRIFRGKQISTMTAFLVKAAGEEAVRKQGRLTLKKLGTLVENFMKKEPMVRAETDWRGSYKYTHPKSGEEVYENVYSHYSDFPPDPEDKSKRLHVASVTGKDGLPHEVRAQVRVVRFLGKGEEVKLVSQPKKVAAAAPLALAELEEGPVIAKNAPASKPVAVQNDDDDMGLLLQ